jgi:sugar phosphate isomerase/epimerase
MAALCSEAAMRKIGIEFISVFGMPPVAFVELAAKLGCAHIGTALAPMQPNPHNYSVWSLRDDAKLRTELKAALKANGVSVSLGEGFLIMPGADMRQAGADLDIMAELGVGCVNAVAIDADRARNLDQLAIFAELADARGLSATVEYLPGLVIGDLPTAVEAVRHVGRANFGLLIDAMHFFRAGARAADLKAIDPKLIGYLQLCDVPLVSKHASYGDEARAERMAPGDGELPLANLLAALPRDLVVGLETPMLSKALAGMDAYERLAPAVEATRALLASVD